MRPVVTALGAVILSAAGEAEGSGGPPDLALLLLASGAGAIVAFLGGRFVLSRLPPGLFGHLSTVAVLLLQGGILYLVGPETAGTVWEGTGLVLGLLPALVCYVSLAAGSYERVGAMRGLTRGVWISPRLYLVPQIPFVLIAAFFAAHGLVPAFGLLLVRRPLLQGGLLLAGGAGVLLGAPFLLRLLFPARPFEGPALDRLRETARRAGIRFRSLLVWETGPRSIANACVAGVTGWSRHVFFTDRLLEELSEAELDAVFAHELSHVRHRHVPLLILFVLGGFALYVGAVDLLGITVGRPLERAFFVLYALAFLAVPFARVSRILELEADLGSIDLGADPRAMTDALEKLQRLSGKTGSGHSWRHFSVPYRVAAIRAFGEYPSVRRWFRLRRRLARGTIGVTVLGGFALLANAVGGSFPEPDDVRLQTAAFLAMQGAARPAYLRPAEEALTKFLADLQVANVLPGSIELHLWEETARNGALRAAERRARGFELLAMVYRRQGRETEARRSADKATAIRAGAIAP
jgi:Zn-dependent protease with chaperone function